MFFACILIECHIKCIHIVVKFKIRLEDRIFSSPQFQGMPSYKELRNALGINEDVRIYYKNSDSQSYFLLSKHLMPSFSADIVLRLSKTSLTASPEGTQILLHAILGSLHLKKPFCFRAYTRS